MGTETLKKLNAKKTQNYLVKKNNPLMGTKTVAFLVAIMEPLFYRVKKNNPLMGTETIH